jgi:UDP-N-acetylglucosamine/UDP-N-acetylgalactosamine diphosphorylase
MQGCFDIGLPSGRSLFQLHAERFLKVQRLAKKACAVDCSASPTPVSSQHLVCDDQAPPECSTSQAASNQYVRECEAGSTGRSLPSSTPAHSAFWYIMTSSATHAATVAFFERSGYFGLDEEQVIFFKQGTLPCLTEDGTAIVGSDGTVRSLVCYQ